MAGVEVGYHWELSKDLHDELAKNHSGKHAEARIRNLKLAIAIANKRWRFHTSGARCPRSWGKSQNYKAWAGAVSSRHHEPH